jgi:hypothetical protein
MTIKNIIKHLVIVTYTLLLPATLTHAGTRAPFSLSPTTSTTVFNSGEVPAVVEYLVTNRTKFTRTLTMVSIPGATQNTSAGKCANPFVLQPQSSCLLSLNVDRHHFKGSTGGPIVCKTKGPNDNSASSFLCSRPSHIDILEVVTDPNFPYGSPPKGNVCVSSPTYYATPETMLGSWAMIDAVHIDALGNALPSFLNDTNVVYAVGTAALGDQLGIPNCSGGCNQLNGYCFALKFNGKTPYPYMIFQSVNIAATPNTFDIYMAGGGSGAFPNACKVFWGTGDNINWGENIENSSCEVYFDHYSSIDSDYSVTYKNVPHTAKTTLQNACAFASSPTSGFNTQNWPNVSVVPVSCPESLTQISGVRLPGSITTIGNQTILNLNTLTDNSFATSTITPVSTTQMQDCQTPSSGYCNNVSASVPNYQASISANLTNPLLSGPSPDSTFCQENPTVSGYCSWNNGESSGGGSYCNANSTQCINCGNSSKWCTCVDLVLTGCAS